MKKLSLTLCAAAIPALLFAWGQKGHDTTAYIAECHLTETTRQAVDSILNGKSIVYWSNWLDNASHTPAYAYTKTWHYKNIDEGVSYDLAPTISTGNIVTALNEQIPKLSDPNLSQDEKSLALKIVVHLMGDIHQPMHMGRATDLGGNRHNIKFFNSDTNLHSAWDSRLVESAHKWGYAEWQEQVDRPGTYVMEEIISGNPLEWGRGTYTIAKDIYDTTPQGTNISYDYISKWAPVIEQQFLLGGLRLAHVLNSAFDPEYNKANK